ncbi:hypothetical protein CFC21_016419 [Triticum aestivum]|uniref:Uncharacterized protein n=2 Tax=Triticum aestivum TaxID=4565 RepID=A0A3B6AWL7_WHEAT|nr:hypothetical protein CFC21_016419 [Triticum aestivum]
MATGWSATAVDPHRHHPRPPSRDPDPTGTPPPCPLISAALRYFAHVAPAPFRSVHASSSSSASAVAVEHIGVVLASGAKSLCFPAPNQPSSVAASPRAVPEFRAKPPASFAPFLPPESPASSSRSVASSASSHSVRIDGGAVMVSSRRGPGSEHSVGVMLERADDTSAGDTAELKWELDEDRVRCVVSFPVDQ